MKKTDIITFFNKCADTWDEEMIRDDEVVRQILDYAKVSEGKDILDVACGTGGLIPDYMERKVKSVTAIDISPEMVKIARGKFQQENVEIICADAETEKFRHGFDCIVVYNAFPHFPNPKKLIQVLTENLNPGGSLTIAHGMSREQINDCHRGAASHVSYGLLHEDELEKLFLPYLEVQEKISNEKMYLVSGRKKICTIHTY